MASHDHHDCERKEPPKVKCSYCPAMFASNATARSHINKYHRDRRFTIGPLQKKKKILLPTTATVSQPAPEPNVSSSWSAAPLHSLPPRHGHATPHMSIPSFQSGHAPSTGSELQPPGPLQPAFVRVAAGRQPTLVRQKRSSLGPQAQGLVVGQGFERPAVRLVTTGDDLGVDRVSSAHSSSTSTNGGVTISSSDYSYEGPENSATGWRPPEERPGPARRPYVLRRRRASMNAVMVSRSMQAVMASAPQSPLHSPSGEPLISGPGMYNGYGNQPKTDAHAAVAWVPLRNEGQAVWNAVRRDSIPGYQSLHDVSVDDDVHPDDPHGVSVPSQLQPCGFRNEANCDSDSGPTVYLAPAPHRSVGPVRKRSTSSLDARMAAQVLPRYGGGPLIVVPGRAAGSLNPYSVPMGAGGDSMQHLLPANALSLTHPSSLPNLLGTSLDADSVLGTNNLNGDTGRVFYCISDNAMGLWSNANNPPFWHAHDGILHQHPGGYYQSNPSTPTAHPANHLMGDFGLQPRNIVNFYENQSLGQQHPSSHWMQMDSGRTRGEVLESDGGIPPRMEIQGFDTMVHTPNSAGRNNHCVFSWPNPGEGNIPNSMSLNHGTYRTYILGSFQQMDTSSGDSLKPVLPSAVSVTVGWRASENGSVSLRGSQDSELSQRDAAIILMSSDGNGVSEDLLNGLTLTS